MKKFIVSSMFLVVLGLAQMAAACTVVDAGNMQCKATFTEPSTDVNGNALTSLDHYVIYYRINSPSSNSGGVFLPAEPIVPATSPSGGQQIADSAFLVPIAEGQLDVSVDFMARAVTDSGAESVDSNIMSLVMSHPFPNPNAPVLQSIQ